MSNMSEREIRKILVELCNSHDKANLVASDTGLQLERIGYSPVMEVYWHNIWREARLQHKELKLIEIVLLDYSSNGELAQIREQIIQQQKQSLSGEIGTWTTLPQNQSNSAKQQSKPKVLDDQITLFYSYAHNDESLRNELDKHLSLLRNQGLIAQWHDRDITAGTEWANQINDHLNTAHIILLLISSDFLGSEYCYSIEMKRALERHEIGEARVIPILLRPVDWRDAPFSMLQALPKNAQPITTWKNRDLAFEDIAKQIRKVVDELRRER
ncbi:MAG TPA: toll/interleukin-1 receptor domain-containing protein [Ktedonobacteraceae bacterium]|nr:toll/interleukin-1 receptor domain-containing protein [Ktedonobacteraceae bacterium]